MAQNRKLLLLLVISGCVIMVQYLALPWTHTPVSAPSYNPLVQAAVNRIQLDSSLVNAFGEELVRNIAYQIGKELQLGGCEPSVSSCFNLPNPHMNTTIYVITPTFRRAEQIPELTRLAQTLMHIPNLVWLVIEDAQQLSPSVEQLLARSRLNYHHLVAPMPAEFKSKMVKPRGVSNRNRGIHWLRENATNGGVMYFADDDNTYDIRLFEEIRSTKKVSMFPVGLITRFGVSSPLVKNGKIMGFYDGWIGGRKFPVDMAGFAVNLHFLFQRPKAAMPYKPGFEEDGFLRSLAPLEPKDLELKADNCTKILVWHTQTKKNEPSAPVDWLKYNSTNLVQLKAQIV